MDGSPSGVAPAVTAPNGELQLAVSARVPLKQPPSVLAQTLSLAVV